jgi:hypothetical protein
MCWACQALYRSVKKETADLCVTVGLDDDPSTIVVLCEKLLSDDEMFRFAAVCRDVIEGFDSWRPACRRVGCAIFAPGENGNNFKTIPRPAATFEIWPANEKNVAAEEH